MSFQGTQHHQDGKKTPLSSINNNKKGGRQEPPVDKRKELVHAMLTSNPQHNPRGDGRFSCTREEENQSWGPRRACAAGWLAGCWHKERSSRVVLSCFEKESPAGTAVGQRQARRSTRIGRPASTAVASRAQARDRRQEMAEGCI